LLKHAEHDILEREDELATVTELAERAAAGHGGVVLIEGPAGIGKTRLTEAALGPFGSAGLTVARARCSELERDFPLGAVRQLLEPLLAQVTGDDRADVISGAAALGASVLRDPESRGGATPYAALHGLYWLTANLATRNPLALAVDDAHWSDEPSLRFLAYLAKRIDGIPVLAMIASRPAEPGAGRELLEELASDPATRVVRPAPLSEGSVTELVREALEPDAPASFGAACHRATGGNPFFVRELIRTLGVTGIEVGDEQHAGVEEIAPDTVARSVLVRLRRLPKPAVDLASTVAILGDGAEPRTAARLAELDEVTVAEASARLAQAELFSPSASLEFAHPIVRAAVYTSLSVPDRARGHERAARLLAEQEADADRVAVHLLAAPPIEEAWAVDVLCRAARAAVARGAPDSGTAFFERALAEPLEAPERADLLVELAAAEVGSQPPPAGIQHLKQARGLAPDPRKQALISLELGRAYLATLKFPEATEVLEEALLDIDPADRELHEHVEAQLLTATTMALSIGPRDVRRLAELVDEAKAGLVTDRVLLANVAAFASSSREPGADGAALAERALAGGELVRGRDPLPICFATCALIFTDRLAPARQVWSDTLAEARRQGSVLMFSFASIFRSHVHWRLGSIAEAEADARAALALNAVREAQVGLPFAVSGLIDALIERGELDEAERALVESGIAGPLPELLHLTFVLDSRARLRLAQGRAREALDDLRECARLLERWQIQSPGRIPWRASAALALASLGERDEAIRVAREEVDLARRFQIPRELGMALRAAGLAEGGDRGVELLAEAVEVLEDSPAVLEHARALTDLGAALRRAGRRSDAREPLRRALELAHRCGATALVERAHAELLATGARPRRAVVTGLDALTASERRVAEMAAEGSTNREIAQALFVTEKTIEWHLGQAYRKLGISSRSELPRVLVSAGSTLPEAP
jgi:tetratricopeptide (TPR) repeat protein